MVQALSGSLDGLWSAGKAVLPNILTLLRLALVPLILWLATSESAGALGAALGVFLLAALTDWLDGYFARTRHAITPFGTVMDPVTDKILVLGLLFVFREKELLPLWPVLVNIFRELFVSGIRQLKSANGKLVGANWMGKVKFCMQVVVMGIILLYLTLEAAGITGFIGIGREHGRGFILWLLIAMTLLSVALALNFLRWHRVGMLKRHSAQDVGANRRIEG